MAFQEVKNDSKFKSAAKLEVGESITGYPTGFSISDNPKAKGSYTLSMNIDGEQVGVSASGNLKWLIKDGKVQMGVKTRITKLGGKGTTSDPTKFKVEQDPTDVLAGFNAQTQAPAKVSVTDKLASLKG